MEDFRIVMGKVGKSYGKIRWVQREYLLLGDSVEKVVGKLSE